jgi:hypothetical protein
VLSPIEASLAAHWRHLRVNQRAARRSDRVNDVMMMSRTDAGKDWTPRRGPAAAGL